MKLPRAWQRDTVPQSVIRNDLVKDEEELRNILWNNNETELTGIVK